MLTHRILDQASRIRSERVQVGVTLDDKIALAAAARRAGKPVSALVREAVADVIARDRRGSR